MALTLVTSDLIHGLDYSKLTGTIPTWNQNTTGNAATATLAAGATILATARNIGGVSFNGSAAIDLPGVNAAGNQNTSGNAGTVTNGVYTVGDQTIAGVKTFSGGGIFSSSSQGKLKLVAGSNEYLSLEFANASGTTQWEISKNNTHDLYFYKGGYRMILKADGKVGIGTTSPAELLEVKASSLPAIQINQNDQYKGIIRLGGNDLEIRGSSGAMEFYNGSADGDSSALRMSISSGGVITTGGSISNPFKITANPGTRSLKLVSASTNFGTFISWLRANETYEKAYLGFTSTSDDVFEINNRENADMTFHTNTTERMRISSAGAIGQAVTPLTDPYVASGEQWMTYQIGKGGIFAAYKNNNESMFGFNTYTKVTDGAHKAIISDIGGSATRYYADRITFNTLTTSGTAQTQTERMRISSGGNVLIGATSDITGTHYIQKSVAANAGILYVGSSTTGRFSLVVQASDSGYNNSPATCLKVGGTSSTSRSISAAGTVNVSGNDYAEYMTKAITDNISKGDVVGINSDGLLTNIFSDAISFVIKSTDPSFVGGDIWGIESEDKDDIEEARIKVDRIAFSGQVPCNVTGASVGDYIIPVASSDGKITGEAVSNPTFEQYKMSVGKVWKIMKNGNSWVAVKIG